MARVAKPSDPCERLLRAVLTEWRAFKAADHRGEATGHLEQLMHRLVLWAHGYDADGVPKWNETIGVEIDGAFLAVDGADGIDPAQCHVVERINVVVY